MTTITLAEILFGLFEAVTLIFIIYLIRVNIRTVNEFHGMADKSVEVLHDSKELLRSCEKCINDCEDILKEAEKEYIDAFQLYSKTPVKELEEDYNSGD